MCQSNDSPHGSTMISTPSSPTSTAAKRRTPTFSPSTGMLSRHTTSGVAKKIEMVTVSGSDTSAVKFITVASSSSAARTACSRGAPERNSAARCVGRCSASTQPRWIA